MILKFNLKLELLIGILILESRMPRVFSACRLECSFLISAHMSFTELILRSEKRRLRWPERLKFLAFLTHI